MQGYLLDRGISVRRSTYASIVDAVLGLYFGGAVPCRACALVEVQESLPPYVEGSLATGERLEGEWREGIDAEREVPEVVSA